MNDSQRHILSNPNLIIVVDPLEGGRVASIYSISSGMEFLTQAHQPSARGAVGYHASFSDGPCAGIEECIPTVGYCGEDTDGGAAPDHGDFWQLAWETDDASSTQLRLHAIGFSRPLRLSKVFSLDGNNLNIHYEVKNLGTGTISFLYACHPLFAVNMGDRICLPPEVSSLSLNYSRMQRIGAHGSSIPWPLAAPGISLDVAQSCETGFAEMLYSNRLQLGSCGLYRNSVQQGIRLRFDVSQLPFLGVWLCYGGWPEGREKPLQNAVALEPTFAPVNTLKEAQASRMAKYLQAGESINWDIAFQITDPGIPLAKFCEIVGSKHI